MTSVAETCVAAERLAAFVDGELSANASREVESHLQGCSVCRRRADELRAVQGRLAAAVPVADPHFAAQVMRAATAPNRRAHIRLVWALSLPALAAAALVGVVVSRDRPELVATETPAPRGGSSASAPLSQKVGVEVFVHPASNPELRLPAARAAQLRPGDGLSFVVTNRSGRKLELCLLALDAAGAVHWFYPAHTESDRDPTSVRVGTEPAVTSLPEGVTPEQPAPGRFTVVALFLAAPARVSAVEEAIAAGGLAAVGRTLPLLAQQTLELEVAPESVWP